MAHRGYTGKGRVSRGLRPRPAALNGGCGAWAAAAISGGEGPQWDRQRPVLGALPALDNEWYVRELSVDGPLASYGARHRCHPTAMSLHAPNGKD